MSSTGATLAFAAAFMMTGCLDGDATPASESGRVAIAVAPLSLAGVGDAEYRVTVLNGGDETVWTRDIRSRDYGDGAGSVSYVGPCDADLSANTVTVELLELYSDAAGTLPLATGTWRNPGLLSKDVTCEEGRDVAVDFDIAIARAAQQGFFDVAVSFSDVFCSAKLDCGESLDPADDLELLSRADGSRGPTVVLGFACTGDPDTGGQTHMYLDNLRIDCGATQGWAVVEVGGVGAVPLSALPSSNDHGYLFAAAVYRGAEGLANKGYWNVALGIDPDSIPTETCTLHGAGTASPTALDGRTTPSGATWPVITWAVDLTTAGARACTEHAVDEAGSGVATGYVGTASEPAATFDFHYAVASATVDPAACGEDLDGDGVGEGCDSCPGLANPVDVAAFYSDDFETAPASGVLDADRWSVSIGSGSAEVSGGALEVTIVPTSNIWVSSGSTYESRVALVGDFDVSTVTDSSGVTADNDNVQTQLRVDMAHPTEGGLAWTMGDDQHPSPYLVSWTNASGCSGYTNYGSGSHSPQSSYRFTRVGNTLTAYYANANTGGAWTVYESCTHASISAAPMGVWLYSYGGENGISLTHTTRFLDFTLVTTQDDQRDTDGDGAGDLCDADPDDAGVQ